MYFGQNKCCDSCRVMSWLVDVPGLDPFIVLWAWWVSLALSHFQMQCVIPHADSSTIICALLPTTPRLPGVSLWWLVIVVMSFTQSLVGNKQASQLPMNLENVLILRYYFPNYHIFPCAQTFWRSSYSPFANFANLFKNCWPVQSFFFKFFAKLPITWFWSIFSTNSGNVFNLCCTFHVFFFIFQCSITYELVDGILVSLGTFFLFFVSNSFPSSTALSHTWSSWYPPKYCFPDINFPT